jgi:hypothetical protein
MRTKLSQQNGARKKFRATFTRIGKKTNYNGYSEDTILLSNVCDAATNEVVTDHVWFTYSKGFENAHLQVGMLIEFEARIKEYTKGYVNRGLGMNKKTSDYKLSHPTKISVIKQ